RLGNRRASSFSASCTWPAPTSACTAICAVISGRNRAPAGSDSSIWIDACITEDICACSRLADHDDATGQLRHAVALERQHGTLDRGHAAAGNLHRGVGFRRHRGVAADIDLDALDVDVAAGLQHDAGCTAHQLDLRAGFEFELLPDGGGAIAGDVELVVLTDGGRALAGDALGLVVLYGDLLIVADRHRLVVLDVDGLVVIDRDDMIVLDFLVHVLLRVQEEILAALLVLETDLVEIIRAAAFMAAALDPALGLVVRQRVRRHVVGVVDAADHQRPVRIAFEETHHHFLPDARNVHRAPALAGPRRSHPDRTG